MAHRILIVEDHVESAESLAELLELWGHETHVAYDGPTGVARARIVRPTVALVDLGLPHMDGCAVARTLRDDGLTDVLLVALTGRDDPEARARIAAAGFDLHVVKPVDLAKLEQLLATSPAG
ncbi:MAG TPA: response regulator [Candidatus Binatia bacterium]|jgi:CheY-like chemotaxis protein|nr:response regulator [Candidatus Binatia bacterium]